MNFCYILNGFWMGNLRKKTNKVWISRLYLKVPCLRARVARAKRRFDFDVWLGFKDRESFGSLAWLIFSRISHEKIFKISKKISLIEPQEILFHNFLSWIPRFFRFLTFFKQNDIHVNFQYFLQIMAQNVNPRPSGTTTFDKDAADRGSSTSSAQVSPTKCQKKFIFRLQITKDEKFVKVCWHSS